MFLKLRIFSPSLSLSLPLPFSSIWTECCLFRHFLCRHFRIFLIGFAWRRLHACVDDFVRFSICILFSSAFSYIYIKWLKLIFVWVCVVCPCSMSGNQFALIWLWRAHHIHLIKIWCDTFFRLSVKSIDGLSVIWHVNWSNIAFICARKRRI